MDEGGVEGKYIFYHELPLGPTDRGLGETTLFIPQGFSCMRFAKSRTHAFAGLLAGSLHLIRFCLAARDQCRRARAAKSLSDLRNSEKQS